MWDSGTLVQYIWDTFVTLVSVIGYIYFIPCLTKVILAFKMSKLGLVTLANG